MNSWYKVGCCVGTTERASGLLFKSNPVVGGTFRDKVLPSAVAGVISGLVVGWVLGRK